MTNAKRKGSQWERDLAKELNLLMPYSSWRRIAMSGAMGTIMSEPLLKADVVGKIDFMNKRIMGECKVGYGGLQMRIEKEWFDKIALAAEESYSIPLVFLKLSGARPGGIQHIVAMDVKVFKYFMDEMYELHKEIERLQRNSDEEGRLL